MSKTSLRRELERLDAAELRQLVIDIYESRREAKEYLDFFVNPDVDKMLGKYTAVVDKEFDRVMRRRVKPRMTRLRKAVKDFSSLDPGAEYVAELMCHTFQKLCAAGHLSCFKEAVQISTARFLSDSMAYFDRNGIYSQFMPKIVTAVETINSRSITGDTLRRILRERIEDSSASIN